jgi:hypothetical protein
MSAAAQSASGKAVDASGNPPRQAPNSTNRRVNIGVTSVRACNRESFRPIDVSVPCKRGQEWLRSIGTPSVLGEGLLERARAISLALLGVTAAVGLAIIALALNQGWPLVAGSSIPVISSQHQAVGKATVAAEMRSPRAGASQTSRVDRGPSPRPVAQARHEQPGTGLATSPTPTGSTDLVVAPSAPARPHGDRQHGAPKQEPTPVTQQPQQGSPAAPAPPAAQPAAIPVTQPPSEATPPAATAEAPASAPDSEDPWSHGNGNGYGHDDWDDDEDGWDHGGSHDWGDHGHGGWHGRH